jgi:predicted aspartyl protease
VKLETAFDPRRNLIIVEGEVAGPLGETSLRLVLDTGSSETLIVPDILDDLGYSPRNAEAVTGVYSAIGKEQGYITRVQRFAAMGVTLTDMRIHAFDLADRYGIDGLIGLSFLRQFNYEIRSAEGRILLEPVAS